MRSAEQWTTIYPKGAPPVQIGLYSLMRRGIEDTSEVIVKRPTVSEAPPRRSKSISLEATYDCNLACRYCFMAEDSQYVCSTGDMSINTAVKYLRKFAPPSSVDSISISFLGGEPTMNMNLLLRVFDYAKKTYKKASLNLTTNGVRFSVPLRDAVTLNLNPKLNDLTIGQWLAEAGFGVTFSLDGPKEVQDSARIMRGGAGSFDIIMDGLRALQKTHPDYVKRFTFRATIHGKLEEVPMLKRIQFFNELISSGIGGGIHFEPSAHGHDQLFWDTLEKQYYEAADWLIEQVRAGNYPIWRDLLTRPVKLLLAGQPKTTSCGAGCNYMTLGVDGSIYACHRTLGAKVGDIEDGVDLELSSQWNNNSVLFENECRTCGLRYLCGGTCRAENFAVNGSTCAVSYSGCFMKKLRIGVALKILHELTEEQARKLSGLKSKKEEQDKKEAKNREKRGGCSGKCKTPPSA